jgi:hypothetical protein
MLYILPQISVLDGKKLVAKDFTKSEIFFGKDVEEREKIFQAVLPDEQFIDRRIHIAGTQSI